MHIKAWLESRNKPGSLANMARRILAGDRKYRDAESTLRRLYILEAVVRFGSQGKAAAAIGMHRNQISQAILALGIPRYEIGQIVKRVQREEKVPAVLEDIQMVPIHRAMFCVDCRTVSNQTNTCPGCASATLWPLETWLERTVVDQQQLEEGHGKQN